MKKCPKCNVLFDTNRKTCPLCFDILKKVNNEEAIHSPYPKPVIPIKKRNLFLRILTYITILGIMASIIINYMTFNKSHSFWSIIVIIATLYMWILITSTFKSRSHIPLKLVLQMISLSIFTYILDLVTGNTGWSINYIIPFISMVSLISIISMLVGNLVKYAEYILYLLAAVILGFIPFLLWLFKVIDVLWPSLSAASLSFATIVGMLVFADRETKEEMKKRFHI